MSIVKTFQSCMGLFLGGLGVLGLVIGLLIVIIGLGISLSNYKHDVYYESIRIGQEAAGLEKLLGHPDSIDELTPEQVKMILGSAKPAPKFLDDASSVTCYHYWHGYFYNYKFEVFLSNGRVIAKEKRNISSNF